MKKTYEFALWIEVTSPEKLFKAALAARIADEAEASFYPDDPEAFFGPDYRNKDGSVNVHACLVQLIDPGVSPDGCEILDSGVRDLEGV